MRIHSLLVTMLVILVPGAAQAFDAASVPETTASLGPFPYIGLPAQVDPKTVKTTAFDFDRRYVWTGDVFVPIEGKVHERSFALEQPAKQYSALEIHRNYENVVQQLGGVKVTDAPITSEALQKAAPDLRQFSFGPGPDYPHSTYLIRAPGKEIWVAVVTGAVPLHGYVLVAERQVMKQEVGLLTADAMKSELDQKGHVALYIHFDVDKADIKPESMPIVEEVVKLLTNDAALKVSIEGHTDDTGTPEHNLDLSKRRAMAVFGALVGKGVAPDRLATQGYGQERPIAQGTTEEVRAKNRRVELVKR